MTRMILAVSLAAILSGCSTTRVSTDDVQLMPTAAARAILVKWYGSDWANSPEVQGIGFTDKCNNTKRRVAYSDFVSGAYYTPPGVLSVIIAEGLYSTCSYAKNIRVNSLEDAKQIVTALNSLGGRIESFYSQ